MAKKRQKRQKKTKSKLSTNFASTLIEKKHKLIETSHKGKLLIKILVTIPPLFYGYLQMQYVDITPLTNDNNSAIILRIGFLIYYVAWVYGTLFDMKTYDISLISPQREKGITVVDYVVSLLIIVVFTVMLYSPKLVYIVIILSIFWLVDLISYHYLMKYKINPLLEESRKEYKKIKSSWSLLRLNTTEKYIAGKWKLVRYYVGFFILSLLALFSFENDISTVINNSLGVISNDFIFSLIFLLFVLSMEAWIWFYRIKTKITMNIISTNEEIYMLVKK